MYEQGPIQQYVSALSFASNNIKSMLIHACIYIRFYNLFIKLIKNLI